MTDGQRSILGRAFPGAVRPLPEAGKPAAPAVNGHAAVSPVPVQSAGAVPDASALAAGLQALISQAAGGGALAARVDALDRGVEEAQRVAHDAVSLAGDAETAALQAVAAAEARLLALLPTSATTDPAELQAAARAALLAEIAVPGPVADLAAGSRSLLPPLRPVDPNYVRSRTGELVARAVQSGRTFVLVSGPSGSGKTFPIEQELRRLQRRYLKMSCGDGVSRGDLIGRQAASNGSTSWSDGPLPYCMRNGLALILDEGDRMDSMTLAGANAALDRNPSILTPWGETVDGQPGFCVLMTCNSLTDESGLIVAQPISADLPNRAVTIRADYMRPDEEAAAIASQVPTCSAELAERIVSGLSALRNMLARGTLKAQPSLRTGLVVAEEATGSLGGSALPMLDAWGLAILNGLPASQAAKATDALRSAGALQ